MPESVLLGIIGAIGVLGTAIGSYLGTRGRAKVDRVAAVMEGYDELVAHWQTVIDEKNKQIDLLLARLEKAELALEAAERDLRDAREEIHRLKVG